MCSQGSLFFVEVSISLLSLLLGLEVTDDGHWTDPRFFFLAENITNLTFFQESWVKMGACNTYPCPYLKIYRSIKTTTNAHQTPLSLKIRVFQTSKFSLLIFKTEVRIMTSNHTFNACKYLFLFWDILHSIYVIMKVFNTNLSGSYKLWSIYGVDLLQRFAPYTLASVGS